MLDIEVETEEREEREPEFRAPRAAPRAPPTAAPPASWVDEGASSEDILRAPPVTITIHTAPNITKMRIFWISIFALYADY
jgi:hypothetical protein